MFIANFNFRALQCLRDNVLNMSIKFLNWEISGTSAKVEILSIAIENSRLLFPLILKLMVVRNLGLDSS